MRFDEKAAAELARRLRLRRDPNDGREREGHYVEPVLLQVVCTELWEGLSKNDQWTRQTGHPRYITTDFIPDEKGINDAIASFYDRVVAGAATPEVPEAAIRAWAEHQLLDGTRRRQMLVGPTKSVHDVPVLKQLVDGYFLRQDVRGDTVWYELAHDRMVAAVREGNERWQLSRPVEERILHQHAQRWVEKEKSPALLLSGAQLQHALKTAPSRDALLTPAREFLAASVLASEDRRRAKRRATIRAVAWTGFVSLTVAFLILGASARRAKQDLAEATASAEAKTQAAEETARQAMADADAAARRITEAAEAAIRQTKLDADRELRSNNAKTASQLASAALREEAANRKLADANEYFKTRTARADELVRQQTALAEQLKQDLNAAGASLTNSRVVLSANQLVTVAQQERRLEPALQAADVVSEHAAATGQTAAAVADLRPMLRAIQGLFERGLVAETAPDLRVDIQSLAISDDGRCTRYVSADGAVRSIARVAGTSCPADIAANREQDPGTPARSNDTVKRSFDFPVSSGIADRAGTVVLGSAAGYLQIVEPPTVAPPFRAQNHEITTAYVSPTGRYVASASSLWKFKVSNLASWDRKRGAPEVIVHNPIRGLLGWLRWWNIFKGDTTHIINAFAIRESQPALLATAREDGAVEFYSIEKKRKMLLFTASTRLLKIPSALEPHLGMTGHSKPATSVAFSAKGDLLASGGEEGMLFVWRIPDSERGWKQLRDLRRMPPFAKAAACQAGATTVQFSPDDRLLAVGCREGALAVFAVSSQPREATELGLRRLAMLETRTGQVRSVVFDPCRRRMLVSGTELRLEEWHVPSIDVFDRRRALSRQLAELVKQESVTPAEVKQLISNVTASRGEDVGVWEHRTSACTPSAGLN